MSAPTRIYMVSEGGARHLIEATNPAQALRHVAEKKFSVRVARATEVAALMKSGVEVQSAGVAQE